MDDEMSQEAGDYVTVGVVEQPTRTMLVGHNQGKWGHNRFPLSIRSQAESRHSFKSWLKYERWHKLSVPWAIRPYTIKIMSWTVSWLPCILHILMYTYNIRYFLVHEVASDPAKIWMVQLKQCTFLIIQT